MKFKVLSLFMLLSSNFIFTNNFDEYFPFMIDRFDNISNLPIINLESLDLNKFKVLKELACESLPDTANWQEHNNYHKNRNRKVYLNENNKFVIKIWQKNYSSKQNFLKALHSRFYNEIALIKALIFDKEGECRGYLCPKLIDRNLDRESWESFGIKLCKGDIGVKIFSKIEEQPKIYKELFYKLINKSKETKLISLDFCPDNIAFNNDIAYLIDLEDIQSIDNLNDCLIQNVFFAYNPKDYLESLKNIIK